MHEHGDMPPPRTYAPWWRPVLVVLSVAAVLVTVGVTGVGVGIVLTAVVVADTAGIFVLTIVRAHRHNESLSDAAAEILLTEHGRWRMQERSRRRANRGDSRGPSS